jgi:hypothetical protein
LRGDDYRLPQPIGGRVFGVRWEAQRHTAFSLLSFAGIRDHLALNAPKNHTRMEKRLSRFALPAQSKMRLGTHDDTIVSVIDLFWNCR